MTDRWIRSSLCEANACLEVKMTDTEVLVRQSRLGRYGAVLRFTHDEWRAFTGGVKGGEFDVGDG